MRRKLLFGSIMAAAGLFAAGATAQAPPVPSYAPNDGNYREHIALLCYGEGERLSNQYRSGYEWNSDKRRYESRSGYELTTEDYDTSVEVRIDGDVGQIRPAKKMVPAIHSGSSDGWYDIGGLSISRDSIHGQFKLNGANRPKLSIDRRSGRIAIEGMTNFKGTCDPLDADRKF